MLFSVKILCLQSGIDIMQRVSATYMQQESTNLFSGG